MNSSNINFNPFNNNSYAQTISTTANPPNPPREESLPEKTNRIATRLHMLYSRQSQPTAGLSNNQTYSNIPSFTQDPSIKIIPENQELSSGNNICSSESVPSLFPANENNICITLRNEIEEVIGFINHERTEPIGKGSYGEVFKGHFIKTDESHTEVAYKINRGADRYFILLSKDEAIYEAKCLRELTENDPLDEKPIARYLHSQKLDNFRHLLIMPLYSMSLDRLKSYYVGQKIPFPLIQSIISQTLTGLDYLKSNFIVHCDLKPSNIFLENPFEVLRVRIGDLGSSCKGSMQDGALVVDNSNNEEKVTRWYRAPEISCTMLEDVNEKNPKKHTFDEKIDTFSLGCIAYELLTKEPLFRSQNNFQHAYMFFDVMGILPQKFQYTYTKLCRPLYYTQSGLDVNQNPVYGFMKKSLPTISDLTPNFTKRNPPRNYFDEDFEDAETKGKNAEHFILSLLNWDSSMRPSIEEALSHPFLQGS